jgi:uncharacterized protein (DUF305 family)
MEIGIVSHIPRQHWALLLLAGAAACSHAAHPPGTPAPQSRASPAPSAGAAQADSVRRAYTPADVEFMTHMIAHHAQAITMAGWAPTHEASPSVGRLAERIINAQQDEIATMQQWLRNRNLPVPEPDPAGVRMTMDGAEHVMLMPGMLTPDQMNQLGAARGPEFDRLFLTFMIQHHTGAIAMVKELFGTNGAGQDELVFKFASDVNVDQTTEVARMQRMLGAMPPETRSAQ